MIVWDSITFSLMYPIHWQLGIEFMVFFQNCVNYLFFLSLSSIQFVFVCVFSNIVHVSSNTDNCLPSLYTEWQQSYFPRLQCLNIHINCLGNDACRIHRANRECLTVLIWQHVSPCVEHHSLKIIHSLSSRTLRKLERGREKKAMRKKCDMWLREKTENVKEEKKSFQELYHSCATLQWLPTPVGRTEALLRREITSLFRRRHFHFLVVSRSHLGLGEVESLAGKQGEANYFRNREVFQF